MSLPVLSPLTPIQGVADAEGFLPTSVTKASALGSFGSLVGGGLESVNKNLLRSQTDLQSLAVGNVENLHQIMIRLEETRLSFQLFMQVRNRLLEAYQDIMKMPV